MKPAIRYLRDSGGSSVAWSEFGSGPLLVCPSWWISHAEKDWQMPGFRTFFSTLGEHFRVVVYDRPGVGLSDRDVPPRTFENEVELLSAILSAVAGDEKAMLFGFSCGAPVAIRFAAEHPRSVDRICCYGSFMDGQDIAPPDIQKIMVETILTHWGLGSRTLAEMFNPEQTREEFEQLSRLQRYSATAEKAAELLQLTYSMNVTEVAAKLTNEMLIIHRGSDRAIPWAAGRRLAASVPAATFVSVEGAAHPPWFGESDVLHAVVDFFVDGRVTGAQARNASDAPAPVYLDARNRQLVTPEGSAALTPLEFGVAQLLVDAADEIVTRDELLEHVWRTPVEGSNKIDAVIRSLRKKFGRHAAMIETVRGHGFRYRPKVPER